VVHGLAVEQPPDDLDDSFAPWRVVELDPGGGVLLRRVPGAEPQLESAAGQAVDRGGVSGELDGIAHVVVQDEGAGPWPGAWIRPAGPRSEPVGVTPLLASEPPIGEWQAGGVQPPIGGTVDPDFAPLRDVFIGNFAAAEDDPGDLGASLCVIRGGEVVVDLWGGWTDKAMTTPWRWDTLLNIYSVGKAAAAVTALRLVDRGDLQLDEPLAIVWPEMTGEGREAITLRHALAHQAGLPAVRQPLPDHAIYDWDGMCGALASTRPWWTPGQAHGYHTNTFGFLVGEPVCRVGGARFDRVLADLTTGPAGADDFFIGLPPSEHGRCAEMDVFGGDEAIDLVPRPVEGDEASLLTHHAYFNPRTMSGMGVVDTEPWREAMVPSTNGHATARSVADFYAALLPSAGDGRLLSDALLCEATSVQADGLDRVLGRPSRFGLGFMLHQDERPIGIGPTSFGHFGYGGSLGFADPEADLAVAYLISRPGDRWQMPRTRRLLAALSFLAQR
jgi:CubicO group peptidase (beta-lactamase class C family)